MTALQEIESARVSGNLPRARLLIQAEARNTNGQVSGYLAYQYALLLMAEKNYGQALEVLLLFVSKHADNASAWFLIGQCSEVTGDFESALIAFQTCIRAHQRKKGQPDRARAFFSLGGNLFRLGRPLEGMDAWRKGLNDKCESEESKFVRGQVRLTLGDYENGWKDYESRKVLPGWSDGVKNRTGDMTLPPAWDGKQEGSVLVYGEQGAGDEILFSRYLWNVNVGRAVVGEPMRSFLGCTESQECEWSAPMGSLPFLLEQYNPIPPVTLLLPKPENPKPKIGVCSRGASYAAHDADRSSPIDMREILRDERWDVVSVQYGLDWFLPKDYQETAEFIRTLDAVVAVDTSVAHVAGTLGTPLIVIPESSPDWRWGIKGNSPWYPAAKVVRRERYDAWPRAIEDAKKVLTEIL